MARAARTYNRDANGRFASGGSGGSKRSAAPSSPTRPRKPRGLVLQRRAVAQGRQKLAARQADPAASSRSKAAQKGALTKAQNKLAAAKESGRRRIQPAARPGVLRPGRPGAKPSRGTQPANTIGPTKRGSRPPLALRANSIRRYQPVTPQGRKDKGRRTPEGKATELLRNWRALNENGLAEINKRISANDLRRARRTARHLANSKRRDTEGQVARFMLGLARPEDLAAARRVITRRGLRAAAAADRGSRAGRQALEAYDRLLAPVMPKNRGKGKGKGRNNIQPGPRNSKGTPPKKRKPRKRKS